MQHLNDAQFALFLFCANELHNIILRAREMHALMEHSYINLSGQRSLCEFDWPKQGQGAAKALVMQMPAVRAHRHCATRVAAACARGLIVIYAVLVIHGFHKSKVCAFQQRGLFFQHRSTLIYSSGG